jgi:hypothetical protein
MLRATTLILCATFFTACDTPTTSPDDARATAECLLRVALEHAEQSYDDTLTPEQLAAIIEIAEAAGETAACLR